MRSMIRRGLSLSNSSGPSPQPSIAPGRKFSISTSDSMASRRTMACASRLFKSSATERLLRDWICHQTDVPSFSSRHLRSGSPVPGDSILMMSAPKSASVLAANGPAISWPSSRTFKPASGPCAVLAGSEGVAIDVMAGSVPPGVAGVHDCLGALVCAQAR